MSRGDRALAGVSELIEGRHELAQRVLEPGEGGSDPVLDGLRVANLGRAIAGGDLAAEWLLGVAAVRAILRGREG